jgi:hypothetical protein
MDRTADFLTQRVFQRWSAGEISTDMAAEFLLRAQAPGPWVGKRSRARLPMPFEVTFHIDPERVENDATVGIVGLRLVRMGGSFVHWEPDMNRHPAVARFQFPSEYERDQFVADALEIPGVSVAPPH